MQSTTNNDIDKLRKELENEIGDISYISVRLKTIRQELRAKGDDSCKTKEINNIVFNQDNRMSLNRIENGKNGSFHNFYKLIYFYYKKGINPQWIIVKDNKKIPKYLDN